MKLIISFSARKDGNCDSIADFIKSENDRVVALCELSIHQCASCDYECMTGKCRYREDDIYDLFASMQKYDKIIMIVPMYCGNPSSLYFLLNERSQDYFMNNADYEEIVRKLFFVGVYGDRNQNPDYLNIFEKWFEGTGISGHVLGIERHKFGQKMQDSILDVAEVRRSLLSFSQR